MTESTPFNLYPWPPSNTERIQLLERLVVTLLARVDELERKIAAAENPLP